MFLAEKKTDEITIISVSEEDLADCLGVSERRVRQMVKEGIAVKVSAGKYDLKESAKRYIQTMKEKEKNQSQSLEKLKVAQAAETLMHEKLKKRKTELVVNEMEKKLHLASDVEEIWNTMVISAKSRITAIPVKVSPVLVGIEDVKEVQSILKREINECLNEISNYDVTKFDKDFEEELYGDEAGTTEES